MENKFIELFAEVLEKDEPIKFEDRLSELEEWDSLAALSLLSMADEEYGVIMGGEDLKKMETIRDVWLFIKKNMNYSKT